MSLRNSKMERHSSPFSAQNPDLTRLDCPWAVACKLYFDQIHWTVGPHPRLRSQDSEVGTSFSTVLLRPFLQEDSATPLRVWQPGNCDFSCMILLLFMWNPWKCLVLFYFAFNLLGNSLYAIAGIVVVLLFLLCFIFHGMILTVGSRVGLVLIPGQEPKKKKKQRKPTLDFFSLNWYTMER